MNSSNFFGWSLLYNSVLHEIRSNQDVLICLTHYVLITNGFECIGIGDSKNMDGNETRTESLPSGWNDNYRLRYVYQGRLYLLQGTPLDDGIMINLIRPDERTSAMVQFSNRLVLRRSGAIEDMMPAFKDVVKQVKEELIAKVTSSMRNKDGASQTEHTSVTPRESRSESSTNPYFRPPPMYPMPFGVGVGVGRRDLDPLGGLGGIAGGIAGGLGHFVPGGAGQINPLGGGGGGMFFQPPRFQPGSNPPGMPPGAIPPGARFDPFRPPDGQPSSRHRPHRPNNDDLPPPGFDDAYM